MQCPISYRCLSCLNNRLQRKLVHLQIIHNPTHWSTNSLKKAVDAPDPSSSTCSIMLDRCCCLGRFMEVVTKKIFYNQADRKCENFDPLEYSKKSLSRCFGTLINPYGHHDHKLYVFFWWLPSVESSIIFRTIIQNTWVYRICTRDEGFKREQRTCTPPRSMKTFLQNVKSHWWTIF